MLEKEENVSQISFFHFFPLLTSLLLCFEARAASNIKSKLIIVGSLASLLLKSIFSALPNTSLELFCRKPCFASVSTWPPFSPFWFPSHQRILPATEVGGEHRWVGEGIEEEEEEEEEGELGEA